MSSSKKSTKKAASFLKDKQPNAKRFKSLIGFCESAESDEEINSFFNNNHELIFTVLSEKWSELFTVQKKGSKTHLVEIQHCVTILKKIITHLGALIKKKWRLDKLSAIIKQGLMGGNKQQIRISFLELLLQFINTLRSPSNEDIDHLISAFASAINLAPFTVADTAHPTKLKIQTPG
jgi:hypothetical protein